MDGGFVEEMTKEIQSEQAKRRAEMEAKGRAK
jgi:hypothetical protein